MQETFLSYRWNYIYVENWCGTQGIFLIEVKASWNTVLQDEFQCYWNIPIQAGNFLLGYLSVTKQIFTAIEEYFLDEVYIQSHRKHPCNTDFPLKGWRPSDARILLIIQVDNRMYRKVYSNRRSLVIKQQTYAHRHCFPVIQEDYLT